MFHGKVRRHGPSSKTSSQRGCRKPRQSISSDALSFADMEILDASSLVIPRGQPSVDFTQQARVRAHHLRFTITASPRSIIPGTTDFDPAAFPSPASHAVCVRALIQNGALAAGTSKHLLDDAPLRSCFARRQTSNSTCPSNIEATPIQMKKNAQSGFEKSRPKPSSAQENTTLSNPALGDWKEQRH